MEVITENDCKLSVKKETQSKGYYVVGVRYINAYDGCKFDLKDYSQNRSKYTIGKEYVFRCPHTLLVELGDLVLVNGKNGLGFAEISTDVVMDRVSDDKANAWVVDKINLSDFINRIENEKKRELLISKLKQKKTEAEEMFIYSKLAENDETIASMLKELNSLGGF